ncbi:MAG TPA: MFS transporter [Acidimicrobiales bacterium]|nr:MFS transporter [Acidimicrobiales bacterium]
MLASSTFQNAIVPLLPVYAHRFGLSSFASGILLSATAFSTLAVSLPAGALADRFGARRLTLASGYVMALGMALQALSPSFAWLLLARLVFGVGFGIVWTAGLSWLGGALPTGSGLGRTVAASGVGGIVGPVLAGTLGQWFGLGLPCWIGVSALTALAVALGCVSLPVTVGSKVGGLRSGLGEMTRNRSIAVALAAVVATGLTWSVSYLLAPEQLQADGVGSGTIGLIISAAAIVYVIGSTAVTSLGRRPIRVKVALWGTALLALTFAPVIVSSAPVALTMLLCSGAVARAVLWTVAYPLAARGAAQRGLGLGVVMGAVQAVWAATAVVSPMLAGGVAGSLGPSVVYALTLLATLGITGCAATLIMRRRLPLRARMLLERVGVTS